MKNIINKFSLWLNASRAYSVPMSIMSWLVAFCWCAKSGGNIFYGLLAMIGIITAHLGVNLFDDYIDFKDELKKQQKDCSYQINLQKGKCKYLISEQITLKQTLSVVIIYFSISILIGLLLTLLCGANVALIALISAILCLLYPKLSYYGLSEITVGIIFSPLLFIGTSIVMMGSISLKLLAFSVSTGLLTIVLLHVHSLMDYEYDLNFGKKTLCTILKNKQNTILALVIMIVTAYVNIINGIMLNLFHPIVLITFLTIPTAIILIKQLNQHLNSTQTTPVKTFWMGPVENWESIKNTKEAAFLLKFITARNLMMLFSLLLSIGLLLS